MCEICKKKRRKKQLMREDSKWDFSEQHAVQTECSNSLSSLCGGTFSIRLAAFTINSFDNIARHCGHFWSLRVALRYSLVPPDMQAGCNRCGIGVLQTCLGKGKRTRRDLRCISHHSCMDSDRKDCSRSRKAGLRNFEKELLNKSKTFA